MIEYDFIALPKIYRHLTGNELKLFCVLFDEWNLMKNKDGWFYRSWKTLRENTLLSNDGLNNAINGLIKKNLLRKKEYPHKEQKSNDYQIVMEEVLKLAKTEPTPKKRVGYSEKESTSKNKENKNNLSTLTYVPRTTGLKKEKINKKEMENGNMDKSSTVGRGTSGHTSSTEIKYETRCNTSTGGIRETDPTPKENNKPQNGIKIYPPSPQEEIEHKRASILKCIESGKKFMYETTKTKDLNEWKAQMEYITIQFNKLKNITPTDAYNGVRNDFKRWWDATKQYFPKGWNEKAQTQQPQKKKLLTKIKESDQQVLQYWIDSTDDNKDEMISRLLSKWEDVYEPDTIAQIFEKSHLNASCASETADVGNYPIQHVKTQPEALKSEIGKDIEGPTVAQIIYINQKQSQYRIN